jgi:hypothetical protein
MEFYRFGFGFICQKLKKPNRTQTGKKPSQTGKTEPKPCQTGKTEPKPSQTEKTKANQFELVLSYKTKLKPVGLNRFQFF